MASNDLNQAKLALENAAAGQALTNAWHDRMRKLDEAAPRYNPGKDDDPKRGCLSPLGGKVW